MRFNVMKRISKTKRTASAESIARLADKGQDISAYFTNKGKMMLSFEVDPNEDVIQELIQPEKERTDS